MRCACAQTAKLFLFETKVKQKPFFSSSAPLIKTRQRINLEKNVAQNVTLCTKLLGIIQCANWHANISKKNKTETLLYISGHSMFNTGLPPLDRQGLFPSHGSILDPLQQTPYQTAKKPVEKPKVLTVNLTSESDEEVFSRKIENSSLPKPMSEDDILCGFRIDNLSIFIDLISKTSFFKSIFKISSSCIL